MSRRDVDMSVNLGPVALKAPVLAAAGTFGYAREFAEIVRLDRIGGLVTKGISRTPRAGNPTPRIFDTPSGMMNSIGLENVGLEVFVAQKLPYLAALSTAVVVNFFGETFDDYVIVAQGLGEAAAKQGGIAALEMNISCPNTKRGGVEFGTDPRVASELVRACRSVTTLPLWVKLTPNVSNVVPLAEACVEAGADALSVANTFRALAIDPRTRKPRIATTYAGLSGPAIKPIVLRMVHEVARANLGVPLVGVGGIQTGEDAAEYLIAGATAVQVGTQSFADPVAVERVTRELRDFCASQGIDRVRTLVGSLILS